MAPLTLHDMLRLRVVLMMMLSAACPIGTGLLDKQILEMQVLRPDGESAWARLIGRVLNAFFNAQQPLIATLRLPDYGAALPVELVECFATCFWAIHACRIAADARQGMHGLGPQLAALACSIYEQSGLTRAELEDDSVTTLFEKMTSTFALGFSLEEILVLHQQHARRRKRVGESIRT